VKNFFSAKTYFFEVTVKEQVFTVEAYFISIANSNQFGNHFTIAPNASLNDGLLDIVIVTRQSKLRVLLETLKQVMGKNQPETVTINEKKKGVLYFQTDKIRINNLSAAPLHIDGDPAETPDELRIEVREKCFRLIQGV
jgi:diacylglycerol kinase family enzyme